MAVAAGYGNAKFVDDAQVRVFLSSIFCFFFFREFAIESIGAAALENGAWALLLRAFFSLSLLSFLRFADERVRTASPF